MRAFQMKTREQRTATVKGDNLLINSNLSTESVYWYKMLNVLPSRGLGTDAVWLSFVEKKGAVKTDLIDFNALIKIVTQGLFCYANVFGCLVSACYVGAGAKATVRNS